MRRLKIFFKGKRKDSDSGPSAPLTDTRATSSSFPASSPFSLRIQRRSESEPVLSFRSQLTSEERKVLEDLPPSLFDGLESGMRQWLEIVSALSAHNGVNPHQDSVCRVLLQERQKVLMHLAIRMEQDQIHPHLPSPVLKLLLITIQDLINSGKFASAFSSADPFQVDSYISDVTELAKTLPVLLRFLQYFILKDKSGLLLHKRAVELVLDFLGLLNSRVRKMEIYANDDRRVLPFLQLLSSSSECASLLGELLKCHLKGSKQNEYMLTQVFNNVYTCLDSLHCSSAIEVLAWNQYSFLEKSAVPTASKTKNLVLLLLTCLYNISLEHEDFQGHLTRFFRKWILTTLPMRLRSSRTGSVSESQIQLYIDTFLLTLQTFRRYSDSNRSIILSVLEDYRAAVSELLFNACYYFFHWNRNEFKASFYEDSACLGRIFLELAQLCAIAVGTKVESFVFALFGQLNDLELCEKGKGKLPVPQIYTLELFTGYTTSLTMNGSDLPNCGVSDLFSVLFSPLFISALEDLETEYEIIDIPSPEDLSVAYRTYFNGLIQRVRQTQEGTESLVMCMITALHQYKEHPRFIRSLNHFLSQLLSNPDPFLVPCLISCFTIEHLFQLIRDCQGGSSPQSLNDCNEMFQRLLKVPEIAGHVLRNEKDMSEKVLGDLVTPSDRTEFSLAYALTLLHFPDCGLIAKYVLTAFTSADLDIVEKLTIGLTTVLSESGPNLPELKKTLAESQLLQALLDHLKALKSPENAPPLLFILKLELHDCVLAQQIMQNLGGFSQVQETLYQLYHSVRDMQKRFEIKYLEDFETLMELLFEMMLDGPEARNIVVPEWLPVILNLLHFLYNAEMKKVFLQRLQGIIKESVKNRYLASIHGVTSLLLSFIPSKPNSELKELIICIIANISTLRFTPENLQQAIKCVDEDSKAGKMTEISVKVLACIKRCYQESLEYLDFSPGNKKEAAVFDVKPRSFFIFEAQESKIETSLMHVQENFKAVTLWMWVKPGKVGHNMSLFAFHSETASRSVTGTLDDSGILSLNFQSEGQNQSFSASQFPLRFQKWIQVCFVCFPSKGYKRKFEFCLYLNSLEAVHGTSEQVSKLSFAELTIGGFAGMRFNGLISGVFCFNWALEPGEVTEMMNLGLNYEGTFLRSEMGTYQFKSINMDKFQILHDYLSCILSPRLLSSTGKIPDPSDFSSGSIESDRSSVEKKRIPTPFREAEATAVTACLTTRIPDALRALGGPVQFFPLLRRRGAAEWYMSALNELLEICKLYCSLPSMTVVNDVCQGLFCEMLSFLLEEVSEKYQFSDNIVAAVIFTINSLDWSLSSQSKAFEKLLLNFKVWRHQSWALKKPVLITITQYLKAHPRKMEVKFMVETMIILMERNFSMQRGKSHVKDARREILDLLDSNVAGTSVYDADTAEAVLGWTMYATHLHPGNSLVYLTLITRLLDLGKLVIDPKTHQRLKQTLWFIFSESHENEEVTVQVLDVLHRFHRLQGASDPQDSLDFSTMDDPEFCELLECTLKPGFSFEVYKALLPFAFQTQANRGKVSFQEIIKAQGIAPIYMMGVLDVICSKLLWNEDILPILLDLGVVCSHHGQLIAEKTQWREWLLSVLITAYRPETVPAAVEVAVIICTHAIIRGENGGMGVRTLMKEVREGVEDAYCLSILDAVLSQVLVSDLPIQSKIALSNFHEMAYCIEDLSSNFAHESVFLSIIRKFLLIAEKLGVLFSVFPALPKLAHIDLAKAFSEYPNAEFSASGISKKREGGILRIALRLLLLSLKFAPDPTLPSIEKLLLDLLEKLSESVIEVQTGKTKAKIGHGEASLCYFIFPDLVRRDESVFTCKFLILWLYTELGFSEKHAEIRRKLEVIFNAKNDAWDLILKWNEERLNSLVEFQREFPRVFTYIFAAESVMIPALEEFNAALTDVKTMRFDESRAFSYPVKLILMFETSVRISIIAQALAFYTKTAVPITTQSSPHTPRPQLFSEIDKQKPVILAACEQRLRLLQEAEEHEKMFVRRKINYLFKRSAAETGLWGSANTGEIYWKIDNSIDGEMRRTQLLVNPEGSSHEEAINKKYKHKPIEEQPPPESKESVASLEEDEQERFRILKAFNSFAPRGNETMEIDEQLSPGLLVDDEEDESSPSEEPTNQRSFSLPSDYDLIDFDAPQEMVRIECERISLKGAVFGTLELTNKFIMFRSEGGKKPVGKYLGSALQWMCVQMQSEKIWELAEMHEIFARRFMHRHTAFEIFTVAGKSAYFNCFSEENKTRVLDFLKPKLYGTTKVYEHPHKDFSKTHYTQLWRKGELSNFEYLMLLNKFANRSYNDISQYPVFPWVLKDYTSQTLNLGEESSFRDLGSPVGAHESQYRAEAIRKYQEWMPDCGIEAFHYGSHYSTGGIVMYYLIRIEPFTSLAIQLQDKHFDVADRLFWSIESAWNGSIKNSGDYKELVPEFFTLPEFLLNLNRYYFGMRQQIEEPVDNVELPPWAGNSAYNFIRLHREALESQYVSDNLHKWIDLIFGYKQHGEEAVKAVNVFFYVTYEWNVKRLFEEGAYTDPNFSGILDQIAHYGQTPSLLLNSPHAKRTVSIHNQTATEKFFTEDYRIETPHLSEVDGGPYVTMLCSKTKLVLIRPSRTLRCYKWKSTVMDVFGRPELGLHEDITLSSVSETHLQNIIKFTHFALMYPYLISGMHYDLSFKVHNIETGNLERSIVHHGGLVTCLTINCRTVFEKGETALNGLLVTGSEDLTLSLWKLRSNDPMIISPSPFKTLRGHKKELIQCCLDETRKVVVAADAEGAVLLHQYQSDRTRVIRPGGNPAIDCIALSRHGLIAVSSTAVQSTITIYSLNAAELWTFASHFPINFLDFNSASDQLLLCGNGGLRIFSVFSQSSKTKGCGDIKTEVVMTVFTPEERSLLALTKSGTEVARVDCVSKQAKKEIAERMRIVGFPCD